MEVLGRHLLLELRQCDPDLLDNVEFIEESMVGAATVRLPKSLIVTSLESAQQLLPSTTTNWYVPSSPDGKLKTPGAMVSL